MKTDNIETTYEKLVSLFEKDEIELLSLDELNVSISAPSQD